MNSKIAAVVLAAGRGTRMESDTPKVLHLLKSKPIIFYILKTLKDLDFEKTFVVVSYQAGLIREVVSKEFRVMFVDQEQPLGTADALHSALNVLDNDIEQLLVVNGDDSAFYKERTVKQFVNSHQDSAAEISVVTLKGQPLGQMARILRDGKGEFEGISEYSMTEASRPKTGEINCGMYLFNVQFLKENIGRVGLSVKGEYYITDLLNLAKTLDKKVSLFALKDQKEWHSINSQHDLLKADKK